jgi:hypothetical protein
MRTEEHLKGELARLRKEHAALLQQPVQDATSWQRMETIGRRTINVLNQLTEHFPGWRDNPDRTPHFGLAAGKVEKVNPDLVARDAITKLKATVARLQKDFQATTAHQQKQIEVLTASLKDQALQFVVRDPLGPSIAAPQLVVESDDLPTLPISVGENPAVN